MAYQLSVPQNDWLRGGIDVVSLPTIIELEFILMVEDAIRGEVQLSSKLIGAWNDIVEHYYLIDNCKKQ